VVCPSCTNENPQENRFCGQCGTLLDSATQKLREDLTREVADQIAAATAGWKDQQLVDVETTEAIVNRVQSWAKLFGFFVALPLLLITFWLGLLGYRTYTDVTNATGQIDKDLLQTKKDVVGLQNRAKDLSQSMDQADHIVQRLNDQDTKLNVLQEQIVRFLPSKDLTPDRERHIHDDLVSFRTYMVSLGLNAPTVIPVIKISSGSEYKAKGSAHDSGSGLSLDNKISGNQITLAPGEIDNRTAYLVPYSSLIIARSENAKGDPYLALLLEYYYPSSFDGLQPDGEILVGDKNVNTDYDWFAIFLNIRRTIGKDAADHLFAAALKNAGARDQQNIDQYLSNLILKTSDGLEGGSHTAALRAMLLGGNLPRA